MPLLDLVKITLFTDDNYIVVMNKHRTELTEEMQIRLQFIVNWFKDSWLKVNESQTEMCLFHRKDQPPIEITLTTQTINSKTNMNVLGVSFDSKLNWQFQIEDTKLLTYQISVIFKFQSAKKLNC